VAKSKYHFMSEKHLVRWLSGSHEGHGILEKLQQERCEWCLKRTRALVVTDGWGRVEVFHDPAVMVRFVQKLFVDGSEAERMAEELVDLSLPAFWRDLYWPAKAKSWRDRQVTPSDYAETQMTLEMLGELKRLSVEPRKEMEVTW